MTYQEKLKDPRWQKKRLEILERDDWACQKCFDKESTLHVHHKIYSKGDPWDIEPDYLITLCEECHTDETGCIKDASDNLLKAVKNTFLASDISELSIGFHCMAYFHNRDVMADCIAWMLQDEEIMNSMCVKFLKSIRQKRENNAQRVSEATP